MNPIKTVLALALLLCTTVLGAQDDRYTEKEMKRQAQYIEANREKLLGNYAKAIPLFEDLLINDPENSALHYELARSYQAIDELQRAIDLARKATELEPTNEWYAVYLADLFQATGQDNQASEVYQQLVDLNPDNEDYYYKWAYFLVRANKASQALKVYENMEKRFGMNEELTRRKHTLYLGIGDFKKAEQELVNLVEAFPQSTEFLHLLAGFYEQMDESRKALKVYEQILVIDPSDSKAVIALTEQNSPNTEDINYLRSLAAVFVKQDVELDVKMVQLLPYIQRVAETGDPEMANASLELCQILESVHPGEAKVYAAMGDLSYYSGDLPRALEGYEKALAEEESVYLVWEQFLQVCAEIGDTDKLVEYSEASLDVFPNQAMLYYFNGLGYFRQGDPQQAVASLEQALLMTGRNLPLKFQVYHLLGQTYAAVGNQSRSNDAFSRALELNPNAPEVLNDFSYALAMQGEELGKAKEMAARANELRPNLSTYQHTYGWVLYRLQEYRAARDWLNKALEQEPDNPVILEHQGDVHFQLGLVDEAIGFWEQAAENGGTSDLLDRKIADRKLYE
jgi:tetratricopeptide (TPR) repeat protein